MNIRQITPSYAVSPQIDVSDVPGIAASGFSAIICNRPDDEVAPDQASAAIRAAAEAAGLAFHDNPVSNGGLGAPQIAAQAQVLAEADGPVLAYCRSGTRSCFVWAFGAAETTEVQKIVEAAARAGYDLSPVAGQLAAIGQAHRDGPA
ncbi:TIGR01244 family phosphatase [Maribius pontilimi]|uniref:TIGR01244 family phosphatase n=1 Tax=Palleronia pontilimi TaxID=1964209 RepID=A0A934IH66_9RHOB|nr:TIGR01244 family sulfur transferase [Palleronia pontilimi]MBJ3762838.1 TIGR01244 family phosphatase [Palleronia pontilimi]